MQVLCMVSNGDEADVACPLCGSAYKLYYSRQAVSEREAALTVVRQALADHHADGSAAHPTQPFNVPAWRGKAHDSAAALLSGAPIDRGDPGTLYP